MGSASNRVQQPVQVAPGCRTLSSTPYHWIISNLSTQLTDPLLTELKLWIFDGYCLQLGSATGTIRLGLRKGGRRVTIGDQGE